MQLVFYVFGRGYGVQNGIIPENNFKSRFFFRIFVPLLNKIRETDYGR